MSDGTAFPDTLPDTPPGTPRDIDESVDRHGDELGDYCLLLLGEGGAVAEILRDVLLVARAERYRAPGTDRVRSWL